ncbi:aldehyde dehydrogenase domain-containing protein [Apiospora marii]|uniref:aldehyde dehydrogenase domain-containing protein n=1 Tax=Apiospora marii TaxID=335849 RepID=UPI00312E65C5
MAAWKLGPALACGNPVVLKPAEQTPLSIVYPANLRRRSRLPAGRGQHRRRSRPRSRPQSRLASHGDVEKIAFTGATATRIGEKGFFVQPTVFIDVTPGMRIFEEEVFGPFVVILPFGTEAEANATPYGLGSAVFTRDLTRNGPPRRARTVEAGKVWINSSNDCDWRVPIGGVRQSGVGRELGEAGLEAYSSVEAIHVNMKSKQ